MDLHTAFNPFRALGVALRLIRRAPLTLLLGGTLLYLTGRAGPNIEIHTGDGVPPLRDLLGMLWVGGGGCVLGILAFVANSHLKIGYVGAVQRVLITGEERTGDLFHNRGLLGAMILARLGRWLASVAAGFPFALLAAGAVALGRSMGLEWVGAAAAVVLSLFGVVVGLYVLLGLLLSEQAVAIESMDAGAAFQRAWSIADGNRLRLLAYALVLMLVRFAGGVACVMTCGLGWVLLPIAATWAETAWVEGYLRFALPEPEEGAWVDREGASSPPVSGV